MKNSSLRWWLVIGLCLAGCAGDPRNGPLPLSRPTLDRNYLLDANGRYLSFHGVNVSGSSKVPYWIRLPGKDWRPMTTEDLGLPPQSYDVSFVGRPFALDPGWKPGDGVEAMADKFGNARTQIRRLRDAGFASFRLLLIWEAIGRPAPRTGPFPAPPTGAPWSPSPRAWRASCWRCSRPTRTRSGGTGCRSGPSRRRCPKRTCGPRIPTGASPGS